MVIAVGIVQWLATLIHWLAMLIHCLHSLWWCKVIWTMHLDVFCCSPDKVTQGKVVCLFKRALPPS